MGARKAQGLSKKIVLVDARKAQQKRQKKKRHPGRSIPHGLLPDRRGPRPPVLPANGHCSTVLQLM